MTTTRVIQTIIIFIFTSLMIVSKAQNPIPNPDECIKNKVQSISVFNIVSDSLNLLPISTKSMTYNYYGNGNSAERICYQNDGKTIKDITTFDNNGNELSFNAFDSKGKLTHNYNYAYKYDKQNRMIESMDSSLLQKLSYKYDEKGNCVEKKWEGRENQIIQYKYNNWGKLQEENYTNNLQGSDISKIVYNYDENGKIKEINQFNNDGHNNYKENYLYGKIKESIHYSYNNNIVSKKIYKYNDNLQLIELVDYSINSFGNFPREFKFFTYRDTVLILEKDSICIGKSRFLTTKYNEFGKPVEIINNGYLNEILYKKTYEYNGNGLLIKEFEHDIKNIITRAKKYVYTFYL